MRNTYLPKTGLQQAHRTMDIGQQIDLLRSILDTHFDRTVSDFKGKRRLIHLVYVTDRILVAVIEGSLLDLNKRRIDSNLLLVYEEIQESTTPTSFLMSSIVISSVNGIGTSLTIPSQIPETRTLIFTERVNRRNESDNQC